MNANFFTQLAQMNIEGSLQLTITETTAGTWLVSVLLQNERCGDNAKHLIPPLTLKGTAEELDNGFFQSIVQPIEQTSSLLLNMESYLKAQEEAKRQSAMEKEKADKEKKERDNIYFAVESCVKGFCTSSHAIGYNDCMLEMAKHGAAHEPIVYPEQ